MTVVVAKPEIKPKSFHFQSMCSFNTPCHKLQSQYGLKSKEHLNNWFLISKCVLIACVCVCVKYIEFSFSVQLQLSFSLLKVGKDSRGGKHWEEDIVLKFPQIKTLFVACG